MNENIVHVVNTEIMSRHCAVITKRLNRLLSTEEAQRMKIISELTELYDSYLTFGSEYMVCTAQEHMERGRIIEACACYRDTIKDTLGAELADVFLASLTLKLVRGDGSWKPCTSSRGDPSPFMKMIKRVSEGMDPDLILDWCLTYANTHGVNLATHLRLKIMYNENRTDWK